MFDPKATPVLVGPTLYEILPQATNKRVDTRAGQTVGTFTSDLPPAFGDGIEFDVVASALHAVSTAAGTTVWTFTPDGGVVTSALVIGGTVYVGSSIGTIFALDTATGTRIWSDNTGAAFTGNVTGEALFGMGAAHGVLVVPAGNDLVAYASAGASFDAGARPLCQRRVRQFPLETYVPMGGDWNDDRAEADVRETRREAPAERAA